MNNVKRVAAIDMGTNSFHLLVGEVDELGNLNILDREREVIRLGSHQGEDLSVISPGEIEKAIDILNGFKNLAEYHNAKLRAIATSAVREAKNRNNFIEKVLRETGIIVEIIDGKFEAELIYSGILKALDLKDKKTLCIDIGGGSTELLLGYNGKSSIAESIKIGAVRLSKKFFPDYILNTDSIDACYSYIESQLNYVKKSLEGKKIDLAVGTSGTIISTAILIQKNILSSKSKKLNGFTFTKEQFYKLYDIVIQKKTPAERIYIPGMELKRADIIPAGLIILKNVFDGLNISSIIVSEFALREGIIFDTLTQKAGTNPISA